MSPVPFQVPAIGALAELLPAFEFEHLIAQGRSGAVYKARQPSLDRDVAIKILPREFSSDLSLRSSFQAEAKAMASLSHPNLIRVYDSGEVNGMLFMVMEYVPGKSLFNSAHGKAIDPKQAVQILLSVCRGLAHAHGNGIIHGDIKHANILLNPECKPKIGSFGSVTGSVQSDIYAIGAMLRELLTGIPEGTPGAEEPAVSDTRLAAICDDATLENFNARYPDVSTLADQLERWLTTGTSPILATPPRPAFTPPKTTLKRPVAATRPHRASSPVWGLLKSCAVIAFLLCTIHILWGMYQTKQQTIARLQQVENAKPKVVRVLLTETNAATPSRLSRVTTKRPLLVGNLD